MIEDSREIKSEEMLSRDPPLFSAGREQAAATTPSTCRVTHQIGFTTSKGYSRDPHRLGGSHHKGLVPNQESSRVHRSDIEEVASSGERVRFTASSTCSEPPQLRFDSGDAPLVGSALASAQLSNSPPIDTNYYLEFQQTAGESSTP